MSEIGDIYGRYHDALDHSLEDYTSERRGALEALRSLYELVFQNLVRRYEWMHDRDSPEWERVLEALRERYGAGSEVVTFTAIDGTCGKETLSEMLVFYGGLVCAARTACSRSTWSSHRVPPMVAQRRHKHCGLFADPAGAIGNERG
jgi:hypothetical protein